MRTISVLFLSMILGALFGGCAATQRASLAQGAIEYQPSVKVVDYKGHIDLVHSMSRNTVSLVKENILIEVLAADDHTVAKALEDDVEDLDASCAELEFSKFSRIYDCGDDKLIEMRLRQYGRAWVYMFGFHQNRGSLQPERWLTFQMNTLEAALVIH